MNDTIKITYDNEAYYVCREFYFMNAKKHYKDSVHVLHTDSCDIEDMLKFETKEEAESYAYRNYSVNDSNQFCVAQHLEALHYEIV